MTIAEFAMVLVPFTSVVVQTFQMGTATAMEINLMHLVFAAVTVQAIRMAIQYVIRTKSPDAPMTQHAITILRPQTKMAPVQR